VVSFGDGAKGKDRGGSAGWEDDRFTTLKWGRGAKIKLGGVEGGGG